jgi:hopanoid biosynthesis associated protein HpnK
MSQPLSDDHKQPGTGGPGPGTRNARALIVAADDFGMSAAVNAGIIRAHRDGILTDASLMVNGQGFDDAVSLARAHPTLSVGLHLVLVQGYAITPPTEIPTLVARDGTFGNNAPWTGLRYFVTPGARAQLRREIAAQLDKFAATGLPLSHVDGHMTIHMHPSVLAILLDLAPRYGIKAMRLPREPLRPALRFDRQHLARKLFEGGTFAALSRYAHPRLAAARIRHPDRMFGMHQTGHVSESYLLDLVRQLNAGVTEVYCHAGLWDDEARRWRPASYNPEGELAAITSPRVRAALQAAGVALMSYRDLASVG